MLEKSNTQIFFRLEKYKVKGGERQNKQPNEALIVQTQLPRARCADSN